MAPDNAHQGPATRIMFGGDVMLGRGVDHYIARYGADYPLGPVAPLTALADIAIVNLECAMTDATAHWSGAPKAFYFRARPQAVQVLVNAGIDMVNLANNHVLDFDDDGLRDTLRLLGKHGIAYAGAGENIDEARRHAIVERNGMRFGMAGFCDHQQDFAATHDTPGIACIDPDDEVSTLMALQDALDRLQRANVDWPILSMHWGPNMAMRPSSKLRKLAHSAVAMGWKIVFGHSAHVFQGVEIHQGCPIIYAAGDLVDDYRVDPEYRNDHQMLFEVHVDHAGFQRILFHPLMIVDCQARPAAGTDFGYIADWIKTVSHELGTHVQRSGETIWVSAVS